MSGIVQFDYDENVWTFIPRTWPDVDAGRSAPRWAARTARRIVAYSDRASREQGRWLVDSLVHLATRTGGDGTLWLCMPSLGGPFLNLQILATDSIGDFETVVATLLRLESKPGELSEPDSVEEVSAVGLGSGARGTFTTDDGEGGEQVGLVWVFSRDGTDVRISVVGTYPENFAELEPHVRDFIDRLSLR